MPKTTANIPWYRRAADRLATGLAVLCVLLVMVPLAAIFVYLIIRGASSLNLAFFTQIPKPVGETGGGMANAIVGSLELLLIGSLIGVPLGVGSGIYLSEYSRGQFGNVVRFIADVLNGVPSIVIGMAVYALLVLHHHYSALSGGVALGIMMIPTITRSTEEMLRLVPNSIREAALGLGIPQWRSTVSITLRTAMSGVVTGIMLAFARVSGETAPLMFTAFGNQFWSFRLDQPIAAMPLQIFVYAISPFDEWHRLAWGGALVLIVLIVLASASVRWVTSRGLIGGVR
ncbi:MAG TPA: phosphate ABC transporter permease PstA [Terriglobales bacterium]|nr:phosphate ABC transporter permease PstA [Terriglobales bacterium]